MFNPCSIVDIVIDIVSILRIIHVYVDVVQVIVVEFETVMSKNERKHERRRLREEEERKYCRRVRRSLLGKGPQMKD